MDADGRAPTRAVVTEPALDEAAAAVVLRALAVEQLDEGLPGGLVSAWRSAGLEDATDRAPAPAQAASPRSTRGTTRA